MKETFFLTSLKDEFRTLQNIDPQYPKHTSMAELGVVISSPDYIGKPDK